MRSSFLIPIVAFALAACGGSSTPVDTGPDVTDAIVSDTTDAHADSTPTDTHPSDASDAHPSDAMDVTPVDVVDVSPTDVTPVDVVDVSPADVSDVVGPDVAADAPADVHTDVVADTAGRVPVNHRADDSACSGPAPSGDCSFGGGTMCHSDSACTTGVNGRCIQSTGGALFCFCTYDSCTGDSDCPTGQTCACHGTADTNGSGNTCIAGNCRVDTDCDGGAGYCSPSIAMSGCGALGGYFCHTAADTCIDDSDCTGTSFQICSYNATAGHWQCTARLLCG